jgi:hypothetical protein
LASNNKNNNKDVSLEIPSNLIRIILGSSRPANYKYRTTQPENNEDDNDNDDGDGMTMVILIKRMAKNTTTVMVTTTIPCTYCLRATKMILIMMKSTRMTILKKYGC